MRNLNQHAMRFQNFFTFLLVLTFVLPAEESYSQHTSDSLSLWIIDTLTYLEEKHPGREFQLVMGSDGLRTFHKWKHADLIVQKYHRLIYPRPGIDMESASALPNSTLVDAPMMEISSSFIRKAIKEGKDIRHLVPARAYTYMREMHFYEK